MSKHNVKININNGYGEIILDGKEIKSVVEYSIYQSAGRLPKVIITVETNELEVDLKEADIKIKKD